MMLTWLACERAAHSRLGLRFFDSSLLDDFFYIWFNNWFLSGLGLINADIVTQSLNNSVMFLSLDCCDPDKERGHPTWQSCWRLFCWKWFLRDWWRPFDSWASVWWSLGYRSTSSWCFAWHLAWCWLKNGLATVWRLTTVWQKLIISLERAGRVTTTMWQVSFLA